ncbi:MAG: MMPL family transporter, partial [Bacteroidota bacterium]
MAVLTVFFAFEATKIQLSYDFAKILPESDKNFIEYEKFKQQFGEDGSVLVIGVKDKDFFQLKKFNEWFTLGTEIKKIDGIEAVVSAANIYNITKNEEAKKFDVKPLITHTLSSQQEVDSIKNILDHLLFYQGFIINKETNATLMAITFDQNKLNTKNRIEIVNIIKEKALAFGKSNNVEVHISGLPFIRTAVTKMVSDELKLFLLLALGVCSVILLIFFRNLRVVLF